MGDRKSAVELPSNRSLGLTFATVFGVLAGIAFWRGWMSRELWLYFLAACIVFLIVSFAFARILRPLNVAWMAFGALLHRVVSPIMLGLIYFGIMSPVALFFKVKGRDELRRRYDPTAPTYWISRSPPGPDGPGSFPRQF